MRKRLKKKRWSWWVMQRHAAGEPHRRARLELVNSQLLAEADAAIAEALALLQEYGQGVVTPEKEMMQ
jgi:hypothetical protein